MPNTITMGASGAYMMVSRKTSIMLLYRYAMSIAVFSNKLEKMIE